MLKISNYADIWRRTLQMLSHEGNDSKKYFIAIVWWFACFTWTCPPYILWFTALSDSSILTYCLNVCDKKLAHYLLPLPLGNFHKKTLKTALRASSSEQQQQALRVHCIWYYYCYYIASMQGMYNFMSETSPVPMVW